ncbi:metalloregulator ArsR/SmtB family transcription factor [Aquibium sp. A9E412]|uniref:ArsR/SmtB family transcription factor n=1 Tax=Aquibium sp. A9E412 TaxID=2976767 RepID=UPI0025B0D32A|nr:metalloregulator ArsR/SmtB family transcription factor [Aquibium sp. A9E412]MDN2567056.1 metalloregulator ArsR/SmtB family transcription factor [Aquibium sp. A9E412]
MTAALDIDRIEESAEDAAELLAAMANPNRLMVLCHLANGEMPVQALADRVGMNQSALSQQLAKLRALKLVATRRDGRTIHYRIASGKVERVLETLYAIYCAPKAAAAQEAAAETA